MRRALVLAVTATLAACGSEGGGGASPRSPRTASAVPVGTPPGVTAFAQTVPAEDSLGEVFPGQANTWVLDPDFSLAAGWGGQYSFALALYLGTPSAPMTHESLTGELAALAPFPYDQRADEVTWLTPLFGAADGLRTAAVSDGATLYVLPLAGERSGYLNGTSGSRLSRPVTLQAGVAYRLTWTDEATLDEGRLLGGSAAPHAPEYRVALRDAATDAVLQELASAADLGAPHDVEIASTVSGAVVLSFELRSAAGGLAVVDDVVLHDPDGAATLGDFEGSAGMGAWSGNAGAESQNVRSGARTVSAGLAVTRTFYAPPAASWARMVDVFDNESASTISTHAVYATVLDGSSPRSAVRAGGKAVVGWDADGGARDVAVVHGDGTALVDSTGASGVVYVVHPLEVPPGGKVALAHFVVQLGRTEGGPDVADVPPRVDGVAAAIAAGFPAEPAYADDLEPGVLDLVRNF